MAERAVQAQTSKKMPRGCIMLGVVGQSLEAEDITRLQHPAVGGVILFARNYASREQLTDLVQQIHALRSPQLLIAVDQEGGRVQRFKHGFTALPAMAKFGDMLNAAKDGQAQTVLRLVQDAGQLMAEELISCGVDFSFAPVLDVGLHADTVIGDRALHADPQQLVRLADAYIDGMHAAGMQATGKHFPGHGHVLEDSHMALPVDAREFAQIEKCDLQVFAALSKRLGAVMTAHVSYPRVDADIPTYSSYWLQDILRDSLGFEGLIVSDDLTMHGAGQALSMQQKCNRALKAGCDLLLICNDTGAMDEGLAAVGDSHSAECEKRLAKMGANKTRSKLAQHAYAAVKSQLEALV